MIDSAARVLVNIVCVTSGAPHSSNHRPSSIRSRTFLAAAQVRTAGSVRVYIHHIQQYRTGAPKGFDPAGGPYAYGKKKVGHKPPTKIDRQTRWSHRAGEPRRCRGKIGYDTETTTSHASDGARSLSAVRAWGRGWGEEKTTAAVQTGAKPNRQINNASN